MTRLTSLCLAYQPRDHKGAEALDLVGSLGRYRHAGRCIPGIFFDLSSTATNEKCLQPSGPLLWQSRGSGPWTETGTLPILIPLRCLGAGNARKLVATISCASGNAWARLFPHAVRIEKWRAIANLLVDSDSCVRLLL